MKGATSSKAPRRAGHLLCLLLALAACDRGAPKEEARGKAADTDGRRVTVTTSRGSAVVESGGGVAALPAGLALYPGAKVTESTVVTSRSGENPGRNAMLSFTSDAAPAAIAAFYRQAAVKAGYRIDGEVTVGDMTMLSATRNGEGFALTAARTPRGSDATLIAGRGATPLAGEGGSR